jgi:hypothetical protein
VFNRMCCGGRNVDGTARLKRALIGIGDSAPIRDR